MSDSIQASRAIVERPLVEIIGEQEELGGYGAAMKYSIFYQSLQILASNYFFSDGTVKY